MMANIGRRCAKEVAEGCIPDQNRPPILILASAIAVDPTITDDFGLEVERRSMPRKYTANGTPPSDSGDITGFENRQCSNGDLHATDSQVNSKYVQIDIGTLTDGLSPNIHRSTAVASHGLIRLLLASFCSREEKRRRHEGEKAEEGIEGEHYPTKFDSYDDGSTRHHFAGKQADESAFVPDDTRDRPSKPSWPDGHHVNATRAPLPIHDGLPFRRAYLITVDSDSPRTIRSKEILESVGFDVQIEYAPRHSDKVVSNKMAHLQIYARIANATNEEGGKNGWGYSYIFEDDICTWESAAQEESAASLDKAPTKDSAEIAPTRMASPARVLLC
ncbi:hypothetical protein THAOC_25239 [Thalassiosira oceanica]|uniref:Uncharacterized protein n=1 Tax=Thalassiosira oceanica TaxID=159749 RepID=K0RMU0_THAOC|nr:hypothetical protein THAOC_25239 [Thalassiosira oceanica]|eukprot:EJK55068.1 hypothetical protein THAOC_25239 [Thalassiosira oceanica]